MKIFGTSLLVTILGLGAAAWYGSLSPMGIWTAVAITAILSILEISLSFDNAVVNASTLQTMEPKWQNRFLTWGMLIAVFGMRLVFPIVIVAVFAKLGLIEVARLAISQPDAYGMHLLEAHSSVAAFGGMFLLMVFLHFILDPDKDIHWLTPIEAVLARLGKLEAVQVIIAATILLVGTGFVAEAHRLSVISAGLAGLIVYVFVDSLSSLLENQEAIKSGVKAGGLASFLYLEVLDASFSFDGVIGAFAITNQVIIIMIGLAIGAMFVRSITIFLVHKGTLKEFVYLEHGAHYAIGTLAVIMLASIFRPIPEVVSGLTGVVFILLAIGSSILEKRREAAIELQMGSATK